MKWFWNLIRSSIIISTLQEEVEALKRDNERLRAMLKPPDPPVVKGTISARQVYNLYTRIFPKQKEHIYIADSTYEITALSEIMRFVKWSVSNMSQYVPELYDCDDFALALTGDFAKYPGWSGFPVTFIWGDLHGGHAFCTAVAWESFENRKPRVYYIEPQGGWELSSEVVEKMELWLLPMRSIS